MTTYRLTIYGSKGTDHGIKRFERDLSVRSEADAKALTEELMVSRNGTSAALMPVEYVGRGTKLKIYEGEAADRRFLCAGEWYSERYDFLDAVIRHNMPSIYAAVVG